MSLPIWGLLEKSVDNPQTIDQAIAEAIAVHESDPTSHLGPGESLQAHKSDSIIDHPAQSVVLDKTPYQNYEQFLNGLGEQNWSNEEGNWGTNQATVKESSLFSQFGFSAIGNLPHRSGNNYPDSDLMYQFELRLTHGNSANGVLNFGFTNDLIDSGSRMVFRKNGTTWRWEIHSTTGLVHSYNISSSSFLTKYYRIFYDSVNEEIVLYEGSTIISTYATSDWKDYIFSTIGVTMGRTTNQQMGWRLRGWKSTFALDIDI